MTPPVALPCPLQMSTTSEVATRHGPRTGSRRRVRSVLGCGGPLVSTSRRWSRCVVNCPPLPKSYGCCAVWLCAAHAANILHAVGLSKRLHGLGITAVSLHPGESSPAARGTILVLVTWRSTIVSNPVCRPSRRYVIRKCVTVVCLLGGVANLVLWSLVLHSS